MLNTTTAKKTYKVELSNTARGHRGIGNFYGVGTYIVYGPGDERRAGWALQPQADQQAARDLCATLNAAA